MPHSQPTIESAIVYWLFDETCRDPTDSGYIGVTSNLDRRLRHHREGRISAARGLPKTFSVRILYEGPLARCLEIEHQLRSMPKIGWNRRVGGVLARPKVSEKTKRKISRTLKQNDALHLPKSIEHREAMRQAQLRAIDENPDKFAAKFAKMRAARALNDHTGINSGPKSETHKQKIRLTLSKAVCKYGHIKPFGKPCPECGRARRRLYRARLREKTKPPATPR